ncbi:unnamed protein product [Leuciscus chuanchicus]
MGGARGFCWHRYEWVVLISSHPCNVARISAALADVTVTEPENKKKTSGPLVLSMLLHLTQDQLHSLTFSSWLWGIVQLKLIQQQIHSEQRFHLDTKTQPPPKLPVGPSHKFANNYYCQRDGRRESVPPSVIMSSQKALTAGSEVSGKLKGPIVPGPQPKELPVSAD